VAVIILLSTIIIIIAFAIMSFVFQLFVGGCGVGRSRHRWEDNIKIDLKEIGWDGVVWIHLTQDRD
jgi:hypothetical protein